MIQILQICRRKIQKAGKHGLFLGLVFPVCASSLAKVCMDIPAQYTMMA